MSDFVEPKEPLSKIYKDDEGHILGFVPCEDMWIVREKSKPDAVLKRANLSTRTWGHWKYEHQDKPWLFEWLYLHSDALPKKLSPEANGFKPTKSMHAFREQSSIAAIADAAERSKDQRKASWQAPYSDHVTKQLIWSWRKKYKDYPWFERWLLRGEDADGIHIARLHQIRGAARAWNFAFLCRDAGMDPGTYCDWINSGRIPDLPWLLWLYGGPIPDGAFVVRESLQRLRSEYSKSAICKAARESGAHIHLGDALRWESDPQTKAGLEKAIEAANKSGPKSPPESETWNKLHSRTRKNIWESAKSATLSACCKRAGVTDYYQSLQQAERCGVQKELENYLKQEGKYPNTKNRLSGLIVPNFFIPSSDMLAFREKALKEWTLQNIAPLKNLPYFDQWFVDWTMPGIMDGRRPGLVGSKEAPPAEGDTGDGAPDYSLTLPMAVAVSGINKGVIWRAAKRSEIANNRKDGRDFRLDRQSFIDWHFKKVEKPEREESQAAVESKIREHVPDYTN
jgi:hypothetical protein